VPGNDDDIIAWTRKSRTNARNESGGDFMTTEERIQETIESKIRPALQSHGGDIDYIGFNEDDGTVTVRLTGACGSCPFAQETLRAQVETVLKKEIPEISGIVRER
jgi:Fe-S cluster biogenesis protein NfuA